METGTFAPQKQMFHFSKYFKNLTFRRRLNVLVWSKGLIYRICTCCTFIWTAAWYYYTYREEGTTRKSHRTLATHQEDN